MAIFKISRDRVGVSLPPKAEAQTDEEEMKQAMGVVGEVPVGKGDDHVERTTDTPAAAAPDGEAAFGFSDAKSVVIKVDGPLGRVFTEALNKILAVEGMTMVPVADAEVVEDEGEVIHVHVVDTDRLEEEDVQHISDDIDKTDIALHLITTESAGSVLARGMVSESRLQMTRLTGICLAARRDQRQVKFTHGIERSVVAVKTLVKERLHA